MKRRFAVYSAMAITFFSSATALAQVNPRAATFDTSVEVSYTNSKTIHGPQGSSANINGSFGWGLHFAYNFNNHLALGFEVASRDADYDTVVAPAAGNAGTAFNRSGTLTTATTNVTSTYYFTATSWAPFVTANIGATWVDTNIPTGPPSTLCWYDPWWGYYCGTDVPTKTGTFWNYGAGLGLRWDSHGPFFARTIVQEQWLDTRSGKPTFMQYRLDLGVRY